MASFGSGIAWLTVYMVGMTVSPVDVVDTVLLSFEPPSQPFVVGVVVVVPYGGCGVGGGGDSSRITTIRSFVKH